MELLVGCADVTLRPNITRAEVATVLVRELKLQPKTESIFLDTHGSWAQIYISRAVAYGIVQGLYVNHFGTTN